MLQIISIYFYFITTQWKTNRHLFSGPFGPLQTLGYKVGNKWIQMVGYFGYFLKRPSLTSSVGDLVEVVELHNFEPRGQANKHRNGQSIVGYQETNKAMRFGRMFLVKAHAI